jgi:hypothetical protein
VQGKSKNSGPVSKVEPRRVVSKLKAVEGIKEATGQQKEWCKYVHNKSGAEVI